MTTLKVVYNSWVTRLLGLDGLVLYPFMLLSTSMEETMPSTFKHEMVHVRQIERDGWCRFYCQYCIYSCYDSYQNNRYEQEAYSAENTALTQTELERLHLPPTFPKTDRQRPVPRTSARKVGASAFFGKENIIVTMTCSQSC